MAKTDETSHEPEGIPPLFIVGAILFLVVLAVIAVVFAPDIVIPD